MEDASLVFYRIKPLEELNNRELVGPSDRVGGTCSSPPVMLNPERTTRSTSVVSFSDEEDLYSAEDRTPRSRNRELINPRTSLDFFKIEHIEHSALQNSTPTSSLSRNQEPIVPPTNSDIESLKSVSEPESDNESWVNEPTLAELEERLCEKSKLMKRLCHTIVTSAKEREISELRHKKQLQEEARKVEEFSCKLQAAGVRVEKLQIKHNEELVAEKIRLNRAIEILDGNTSLIASLETAHKKNLTFVKAQYDRRLFVVEKRRLSELAELEKKIQKCEEDWAAERRGFVEKLEAKTNYEDEYLTKSCSGISLSARALGSRLQKAAKCNRELQARLQSFNEYQEAITKQILLHEDTILKEHALKLTESSIRIPDNSPRPLGHNRVEFPAPLLTAQIRGLQQQVADITEERKSEKEMHMILQCKYFNLHSKYMAMCAQPGSLVEAQLRLAFLEKNRVPELTGQIEELEREIRSRDDLHRQEKENQESKYKKLLLDYNEPGKESKQGDKTELEMFRKIKVPALLGQVSGLQQLVVRIKAQHAKQSRLRDSVISALDAKYETLSKEHEEACASYQRVQEAQNELRPQKELQQQLADLKVSMENMSKVQRARYEVLDIQMSSVLRHDAKDTCSKYDLLVHAHTQLQANFRTAEHIQMQLEQSRNQMEVEKNTLEHEKDWLERRLKESDRRVYWAHHGSRDNCKQRQDLMNLNYRLKRDTVEMARDKMSAKTVEEYAMQSIDALDMRPSS